MSPSDAEMKALQSLFRFPIPCDYINFMTIGTKKAYSLDCDFKQFLIRFIKTYGEPFYAWGANWGKSISTEER